MTYASTSTFSSVLSQPPLLSSHPLPTSITSPPALDQKMAGDKPYPEVPVGNKSYSNAAVVIIGAGISGMCTAIDLVK